MVEALQTLSHSIYADLQTAADEKRQKRKTSFLLIILQLLSVWERLNAKQNPEMASGQCGLFSRM